MSIERARSGQTYSYDEFIRYYNKMSGYTRIPDYEESDLYTTVPKISEVKTNPNRNMVNLKNYSLSFEPENSIYIVEKSSSLPKELFRSPR